MYYFSDNSSLFNEFVCKLFFFLARVAHECQKRSNLHTNELNTTLESLKLA
jgi:hypothetical protein